MAGRLIFRLDDITPGINEDNFDRIMFHFLSNGIRPLLGLVPDNHDPELQVQEASDGLWEKIQRMVEDGLVDIAQHGYQHCLYDSGKGVLNRFHSFSTLTEFAGRVYEQQFEMIREGRRVLQEKGLATDIWMAPAHSFDHNTLTALRSLGFRRVSDGVGLYPYYWQDLLFVPQQLGKVRKVPPFGIWTVCLHINTMPAHEIERIANMLPFLSVISFPGVSQVLPGKFHQYANNVFRPAYAILRALKRSKQYIDNHIKDC